MSYFIAEQENTGINMMQCSYKSKIHSKNMEDINFHITTYYHLLQIQNIRNTLYGIYIREERIHIISMLWKQYPVL